MADPNQLYDFTQDDPDSFTQRWGGLPVETPRFNLTPNTALVESEPKQLKQGVDPFTGRPDLKFVPVEGDPWKNTSKPIKRLLGVGGEERYQLWPERILRSGLTAPLDALTGKMQVNDPETGMPTREAIERSQDVASVAGPGGLMNLEPSPIVGSGLTLPAKAAAKEFLPNGIPKPEAFDRVLPAVRNMETGKISTAKRGDEHADILQKQWTKAGGDPYVSTMDLYKEMLPKNEMGFYDPKNKQFFPRNHPEWEQIDSPDLNPRQAMKSGMVFSDTQKPGMALAALRTKFEKLTKEMDEAEMKGVELPQSKYDEWNELQRQKWANEQGYNIEAYHGTNSPSKFDMFRTNAHKSDLGSHFGTVDQANQRAIIDNPKDFPPGSESRVIPARLNIQNPLRLEDKGLWKPEQIATSLREKGFDKTKVDKYIDLPKYKQNEYLKKIIEDEGYDGIVYLNRHEGKDVEAWRNNSGLTEHDLHPNSIADDEFHDIVPTAKDSYIAFHPHQIRSPFAAFNPQNVGKAGMFLSDTQKPGMAMAALHDAPTFYSAVEHAVNNGPKQALPNEWLGPKIERKYTDKNSGKEVTEVKYGGLLGNMKGVKPEELEWMGLPEWLQEKANRPGANRVEPVTKQEIQDFVSQNKVELKEVNKGDEAAIVAKQRIKKIHQRLEEIQNEYDRLHKQPDSAELIQYKAGLTKEKSELYQESKKLQTEGPQTKFSQYQLPGGENYREKLLTLPEKQVPEFKTFDEYFKSRYKEQANPDNPAYEMAKRHAMRNWEASGNKIPAYENAGNYISSHWDEPNVLAHVRMNDRFMPDENGPRQYNKPEIMSVNESKAVPKEGTKGYKSLHIEEIQSDWHQQGREKGYKPSLEDIRQQSGIRKEDWDKMSQSQKELIENGFSKSNIPNAPFKKNWHELALKRMIREAAEKGYDRISWTPGEAQAARYDLSQHVNSIRWEPQVKGEDSIVRLDTKAGSPISLQVDKGGKVVSTYQARAGQFEGKHLSDIVGKEIAEKITSKESGFLKDQDLKVGGEGMKGFYDKMIPAAIEKIGKEHGVKVKTADLGQIQPITRFELRKSTTRNKYLVYDRDLDRYVENSKLFDKKEAEDLINSHKDKTLVHYIDIPESLKNVAMKKGFPLFSGGFMFSPVAGNPHERK